LPHKGIVPMKVLLDMKLKPDQTFDKARKPGASPKVNQDTCRKGLTTPTSSLRVRALKKADCYK
jgi:hypothetical protein